jgi:hypothetical protein
MVRSTSRVFCALSAVFVLTDFLCAQQKSAYELLPASSQAVLWIPNSEALLERWDRTQLSQLAEDPAVRPFFDEQRQAIENRFMEAGWRLNVTPEDLTEYATGQIALAWMEMPQSPRKPFALAMLVDVEDDEKLNRRLLDELDRELSQRKPTKASLQHAGVTVTKYTMPKRADQLLAEASFYAIADGLLIATDDEQLIRDMLSRALGQETAGEVLANDAVFVEGRQKLQISGEGQVEYFVRPLGLARVFRSIGGKRSKSNADLLAVLQSQGFSAIKCIAGEVSLGQEWFDMQHRGYILADRPLPNSAGILDFPNKVDQNIPSFVGSNVSTYLALNWNSQDAFWRVKGLVDELAGTPGVFDEMIEGIKSDPNGPRIDISQDVLPQLTNDIYAISDSRPGEPDVDSRRNLIALKVKDTEAMSKVLNRVMRDEPDGELVDFNGHAIWQVVRRKDQEVDLIDDFGEFGAAPAQQPAAGEGTGEPEPWLNNWAITVYDGYLMFASHVEVIEEAIVQAKAGGESPLVQETDWLRINAALNGHFGAAPASAWQIVRNSLAYRVQYELFRAGKLQDSQSMLASLLDHLLQNESEIKDNMPKISGQTLPPFEKISHFLQPGGLMFRTTDHGWEFGGMLLSAVQAPAPVPTQAKNEQNGGTARVSNAEAEAKR